MANPVYRNTLVNTVIIAIKIVVLIRIKNACKIGNCCQAIFIYQQFHINFKNYESAVAL